MKALLEVAPQTHMANFTSEETVESYIKLPYTRELIPNADGTWFARIVEFPGCMTEGDTVAKAHENLEDAMRGWISVHMEDGETIPSPIDDAAFSGKFLVRVAKSLHRALVRRADIEGVSLNQFVNTELARSVGC